jgi:hypothetical protein
MQPRAFYTRRAAIRIARRHAMQGRRLDELTKKIDRHLRTDDDTPS